MHVTFQSNNKDDKDEQSWGADKDEKGKDPVSLFRNIGACFAFLWVRFTV